MGRQAKAEFGIAWYRHAWDADQFMGLPLSFRAVFAAGSDHGDVDAALVEAVDQAAERHGDAVNLGRESFRDQ